MGAEVGFERIMDGVEIDMEELIRRSDAIDAIHTYWIKRFETLPVDRDNNYLIDRYLEHNKALCNHIKSIPSADRWILCSEREPNEFEDVLVLLSDGTMDVLQLTDYLDIWGNVKWCHAVHHGLGYSVSDNDVVAWMPLPKPYEKGADDEGYRSRIAESL